MVPQLLLFLAQVGQDAESYGCLLALWSDSIQMKTHHVFEEVPRGLRFVAIPGPNFDGIWVPIPVYWMICGWRKLYLAYLRLAYLRWKLRRK
jgi:hypothetical protein